MHTTTDSSGAYAITLPPGVYSAFALDLNEINAGFFVAGTRDKTKVISVPPATVVDFVAYAIS